MGKVILTLAAAPCLHREMLRIKRSVAASFSQVHYNTSIVEAATAPSATGAASFIPCS